MQVRDTPMCAYNIKMKNLKLKVKKLAKQKARVKDYQKKLRTWQGNKDTRKYRGLPLMAGLGVLPKSRKYQVKKKKKNA